MAYKEVTVRIGLTIIAAIMMLEIPGHIWLPATLEQKYNIKVRIAAEFMNNFPLCKSSKLWVVYDQERNVYQVWIRCIDTERRC